MHRFFLGVSRGMAIVGGLCLTALIVITCVSILGRALSTMFYSDALNGPLGDWLRGLGIGAIPGNVELVEAGMAFTIFAFLPYTQITSGHASVDIFTSRLPPAGQRLLALVIEAAFAAVLVIIALQLYDGMNSKMRSGQTTLLLQFPLWWAYAASLSGAVISAIVAVYMAVLRVGEAATGRDLIPADSRGQS